MKRAKSPKKLALKPFWDGDADDDFTFARFNWETGNGDREPIAPKILAKRRPGHQDAAEDSAERVEVLLPAEAAQIFADPDFLVDDYERNLAANARLAYAQVTVRFKDAFNLHFPYETARTWVRSEYVDSRGLPVILVLHAPFRKGSDNLPHAHAMVLPRRLTRFGWGKTDFQIGNDRDRQTAKESWFDCYGLAVE